jgi:hypothetical protein
VAGRRLGKVYDMTREAGDRVTECICRAGDMAHWSIARNFDSEVLRLTKSFM